MSIAEHVTPEYWDALYTRGRKYLTVTNSEIDQFRRFVPHHDGTVVVDVGCGSGEWARIMAAGMAFDVTGYDLSPVAIEQAKALNEGVSPAPRFAVWDANSGTVPDGLRPGSVDIVTCRLTIAFLDRARFLDDVGCWLTPDGTVVIVTGVHERLDPSQGHRGLTEQEIEKLGVGWRTVNRYNITADGAITALTLRHST
ncbi:class I SAM-dependent methyltransferase [Streptomyces sp. NPDC001691]|uniref:class I SAM-dependent methyltransferase n=1 Tax=Streptomyces sp. NPDC001691 TaxID=3364600 RepID=UPI003697246E